MNMSSLRKPSLYRLESAAERVSPRIVAISAKASR